MGFFEEEKKGLARFLKDSDLEPGKFSIHVSERAPGKSAHQPHVHDGIESFLVLRGEVTVQTGEEEIKLVENESIVIDPRKPHTITNSGTEPNRYVVVLVKP